MQIEIPNDFYTAALSIIVLSIGSIFALMQGSFPSLQKIIKKENAQLFFLGLALSLSFFCHPYTEYLGGSFVSGPMTSLAQNLILSVSLFISLLFRYHPLKGSFFKAEISFLYLIVTTGMLIFTSSHDFVTLLVALEISSLGGYTLIGYLKPTQQSLEGAIKYFILGSVATAFMLFGIGFIYLSSGSLNIDGIIQNSDKITHTVWLEGGLLLLLSGLSFKLALAPFHLWTPDAYEGAATGITALMATSFKTMIIFLFLRLLPIFETIGSSLWAPSLSILVCLSILTGSLMALSQKNLKRTLAYSSIAHSGYMAIALCFLSQYDNTSETIIFYLASYTLASLLSFGSLMFMETKENQNLTLDNIKGYSKKNPWLSFVLSFSLFSLAGLPPTVGFLGKLFLFKGALENGFIFLVFVGILGSTVSLYYYLRIIVFLYMAKEESTFNNTVKAKKSSYLLAFPLSLAILLGTILPQSFLSKIGKKSKKLEKRDFFQRK